MNSRDTVWNGVKRSDNKCGHVGWYPPLLANGSTICIHTRVAPVNVDGKSFKIVVKPHKWLTLSRTVSGPFIRDLSGSKHSLRFASWLHEVQRQIMVQDGKSFRIAKCSTYRMGPGFYG